MADRSDAIDGRITVTASGIAKMAGVGRAAVSNWRRRYVDFPSPTGGTAVSPVFAADEVEQWLELHGKMRGISKLEWLWRHVESYTPAVQIGDALGIVGAYLLHESWHGNGNGVEDLPSPAQLIATLGERDGDLALLVAAIAPEEWSAQLETILMAAAEPEIKAEAGASFEYLHAQYAASSRSLSGPDATPPALAEIMLDLAGNAGEVFDFTCGTGSIVHLAAEQALVDGREVSCKAQEIRAHHALTTLLRLRFVYDRGVLAGLTGQPPVVRVGDSLLNDLFVGLTADVVVANPPFGIHEWGREKLAYDSRWEYGLPPRTEPELAWVQHALAHLVPGGVAVLLMPPASASRPAGRRIRGELVRHGALLAVLALPAGMVPPAAVGLHLWVLTRPVPNSSPSPRLLFVDASTAHPHAHGRDSAGELIGRAWRAYRSGTEVAGEPGIYHVVSAIDVLDEAVDLTPRRFLPLDAQSAHAPEMTLESVSHFAAAIGGLLQGLPPIRAANPPLAQMAPKVDLADLIRSGSLSVHKAATRAKSEEGVTSEYPREVLVLTAADVISGGAATGVEIRTPGTAPTAQVEAGDILIPTFAREIVARVAASEQVGAELGSGVQALRVDQDVLDPWFLAGVLSRSDNARVAGRVSTSTTGHLRIDVTRLAVPVLPIVLQREYGNAFRILAEFQVKLARAAEEGSLLAQRIRDGLAGGTLGLSGDAGVK